MSQRHDNDDPRHDHTHHARPAAAEPQDGTPVLVEVTRGGMVESRHCGAALIADRRGRVLDHWGDFDRLVFPRSAVKPLQALPLVETGAADAFGVTDEELALACASHNGEPVHVEAVAAWLARIGCSAADLECGAHPPIDATAADMLVQAGQAPTALHNNCSGKHAGFLAAARHQGEPLHGYVDITHPVQQRVLGVLEQMTGQDLGSTPRGIDGCSIPTYGIPLGGLAVAMARLADPADLPERRIAAVLRVRRAWGGRPYYVAGRHRLDTLIMQATGGAVLVKGGAEGVRCAALPEFGFGIALKIEDGAARAADVALAALLRHVGALDDVAWQTLTAEARPLLTNHRGLTIGEIRPADGFPV